MGTPSGRRPSITASHFKLRPMCKKLLITSTIRAGGAIPLGTSFDLESSSVGHSNFPTKHIQTDSIVFAVQMITGVPFIVSIS